LLRRSWCPTNRVCDPKNNRKAIENKSCFVKTPNKTKKRLDLEHRVVPLILFSSLKETTFIFFGYETHQILPKQAVLAVANYKIPSE
jgi:hypothetical protein